MHINLFPIRNYPTLCGVAVLTVWEKRASLCTEIAEQFDCKAITPVEFFISACCQLAVHELSFGIRFDFSNNLEMILCGSGSSRSFIILL